MGLSLALGYIKPIAVTCIALWLCLTLAPSVTICHQFRHSHTHPRGSWGMRREVCAGSVCVCVCVCVCTLLPAHCGEDACRYNQELGDCV